MYIKHVLVYVHTHSRAQHYDGGLQPLSPASLPFPCGVSLSSDCVSWPQPSSCSPASPSQHPAPHTDSEHCAGRPAPSPSWPAGERREGGGERRGEGGGGREEGGEEGGEHDYFII